MLSSLKGRQREGERKREGRTPASVSLSDVAVSPWPRPASSSRRSSARSSASTRAAMSLTRYGTRWALELVVARDRAS